MDEENKRKVNLREAREDIEEISDDDINMEDAEDAITFSQCQDMFEEMAEVPIFTNTDWHATYIAYMAERLHMRIQGLIR